MRKQGETSGSSGSKGAGVGAGVGVEMGMAGGAGALHGGSNGVQGGGRGTGDVILDLGPPLVTPGAVSLVTPVTPVAGDGAGDGAAGGLWRMMGGVALRDVRVVSAGRGERLNLKVALLEVKRIG